ncbi:helix-turn-helix domain-containing protein [Clostridium sporogenes]|uniref:helix-turn-helix domain-containing protein n=1 Tax=Clostridium sporogenes TaxID=1509 RepID=UPI0023B8094E|nr:helix-turn-helix transcriptional regulator [Clostridium sporogenes]
MTTDKVAKKLDISRRQYSRLENGHVKELDEVKIEKLANLFKVTKQTIKEAWENSKGGIINDRNNKN